MSGRRTERERETETERDIHNNLSVCLSVCLVQIHKTRRHMDASAFNEFWLLVEDYIRMHRPWLMLDKK